MVDIHVHAHIIGGLVSMIIAVFLSTLCFKRLSDMAASAGSTFSVHDYGHLYFPEPSKRVLKGVGIYFMFVSILGYMLLTITEIPYGLPLFSDTFHMTLYSVYSSTGIVYLMEGYSAVPADSGRLCFAVGGAFAFLLVMVHSGMKNSKVAELQHQLLGLTLLISSVGLFSSIAYKNCLAPYVVFLAGFTLQSMWWITIGVCFLVDGIDMGDICVYFCLEGMGLFFVGLGLASKLEQVSRGNAGGASMSKQKTGEGSDVKHERSALMVEETEESGAA